MTEYFYEALPYSPDEVEVITDLDPATQRDWRRRGLVQRKRSGGTMPDELAQFLIVQSLRDEGSMRLEAAARCAPLIAPMVLWFALTHYRAFDFEGTREEDAEFRTFIERKDKEGLAYLGEMVGADPKKFFSFSIFRREEWLALTDLNDVPLFETLEPCSVWIVLDHDALGRRMFEKIKRPIFTARPRRAGGSLPPAKPRRR